MTCTFWKGEKTAHQSYTRWHRKITSCNGPSHLAFLLRLTLCQQADPLVPEVREGECSNTADTSAPSLQADIIGAAQGKYNVRHSSVAIPHGVRLA